ncbi:MAG: FAD-dependent oxidoreductase [Lentisphaeria bacterium]|nr:FAD-dependent oxidoreductase [Lentisphaeria bacterium]
MNILYYDCAVIGAGAAGLCAGARTAEKGLKTIIIDRESHPGGVLLQCIHNGFGLHYFKEQLTGPEYAGRVTANALASGAVLMMDSTVTEIRENGKEKLLTVYSGKDGVTLIHTKSVILAMGCRERCRGNLGIPGDRVAGIYTAGAAQKLLNMQGVLPGRTAVIAGSGDIGLIMARRLSWCGVDVKLVTEIMPYPAGLSRNIAQCLEDFNIPLRLSTSLTGIYGKDRVEYVTVAPIIDGKADHSKEEKIFCDTVLFSVGLIPENELSRSCGIKLHPVTNGPVTDSNSMTGIPGIFACGNVLHVHDLVDFVSREAETAADNCVQYIAGMDKEETENNIFPVSPEGDLRYCLPCSCKKGKDVCFYMRSSAVRRKARLTVSCSNTLLAEKILNYVKPAEMISLTLEGEKLCSFVPGSKISVTLSPVEE